MTKSGIAKFLISSILIIAGIIWSVMFPKSADISKPDFAASVAVGAGLILTGCVVLLLKKHRFATGMLSILLIWSLLLNLFLFSYTKWATATIKKIYEEKNMKQH